MKKESAQNAPIPFKFSLLPGDLINALAGIRHVCERQKKKAAIYLGLNIQWRMDEAITAGRKSPYTLTQETLEFLKPLLLSQSYISSVESLEEYYPDNYLEWTGLMADIPTIPEEQQLWLRKIEQWYINDKSGLVDLDKHHLFPVGLPNGNIFRWNFYVYPDMAGELSTPWINVNPDDSMADYIVINRTLRCRNESIAYSFLKKYDNIMFVGLPDEYYDFKDKFGIEPHFRQSPDAEELAMIIRSCKVFIGNQSLCYSLAEAMKVPRILEICNFLPNVIPTGPKAYDFYFQGALEFYVDELMR